MSQTINWSASKGMPIRRHRTSGATAGQGNSKRLYVGRYGSYDYDSLLQFSNGWAGVGKIVSAYLNIWTGDGLGDMPSTVKEHPHVIVRRNTGAWTEGNAADGDWQSNDYDTAPYTTSDQRSVDVARATETLNRIDITAIVEDWAPKTVKRRSGSAGGGATNYGLTLSGTTNTDENIDFLSEDWADASKRPFIELNYEYGATVPNTPTNLTPSGAAASFTDFQGDFSDVRTTDTLKTSTVQVYDAGVTASAQDSTNRIISAAHGLIVGDQIYFTSIGTSGLVAFSLYYVRAVPTTGTFQVSLTPTGAVVDITADSTVVYSKLLYSATKTATATEIGNNRFAHVPDDLHFSVGTNYRWRARVTDQEGQVSAYTALVTFSVTNNDPNAPTLTPVNASSFTTLDGVVFRATFSDPDAGDYLIAYQFQMSAYPSGDARWMDDANILWNTGKRYVGLDQPAEDSYGGAPLAAGTYYWRARVWDNKQGASSWTYASITTTTAFEPDPEVNQNNIQLRIRAPWRIVIKGMAALRGPGTIVAVLEDAQNVGASEMYNSPGELHFTLPIDHPQLSVLEVKQTHYSVQFRTGDGWREKFAGLMWDFDATDTGIVFYGLDYLALLNLVSDERYDASNPERPSEKGGSKYVTSGKNSIRYIVMDQLNRERVTPNSPLGFITVGSVATMNETLVVYSTYSPRLTFITGLLDSHKNGTGKRTRIRCRQTTGGGYEWVVQDDPGQNRDNLRLRYGELVQGYRVVAFGNDWASRVNAIGRAKDGIKVLYKTALASGISESTWGRFSRATFIDGVSDENDLIRRTQQLAVAGGKLGKQIGLGIRTGWLQPKDGYDLCDRFPINIEHGSVSTSAFGSGYWNVVGITWEAEAQNGKQNTTLTFQPKEDAVAPNPDLLTLKPISTQSEWQIGYIPPPSTAVSRFYYDGTTGIVYERVAGTLVAEGITGTA
jgi:hypothetical protein